jgi:hypothetical protein
LTVISEDDYLSSVISDSNLSLILKANPVMWTELMLIWWNSYSWVGWVWHVNPVTHR